MSDLISRKQAYDMLVDFYNYRTETEHRKLREALRCVPDAVSTGRWIRVGVIIENGTDWMRCSNCGFHVGYRIGYNFCPKCGAKMEEWKE